MGLNIVYGVGEKTRKVYVLGYVFVDTIEHTIETIEYTIENAIENTIEYTRLGKNKAVRNWDWIEIGELSRGIVDGIEEGEIGLGVYSKCWDKNKIGNFKTKISNFRIAFFKEDRIEDIFGLEIDWENGWDECVEIMKKKLEECDLVHGRFEVLDSKGECVNCSWEEIEYVGIFEIGNEIGVV